MINQTMPSGFFQTNMYVETKGDYDMIYSRKGVVLKKGNEFISCRSKNPCQQELENKGCCSHKNDDHRLYNYHYSEPNGKVINDKAQCRYPKHKCWEKFNSKHNNTFYHL